MDLSSERDVIQKLVARGEIEPWIRAMILTSTRASPDGSSDLLSDHDVIVAVQNPDEFAANDAWVSAYGPPMTRWGDESELYGLKTYFRGVVYRDGARVDYTIWPEDLLERVTTEERLPDDLDVGYRVLLDKDGRTAQWQPPAYRAHIPAKPTAAEYRALVEEFWWDASYVAKALWRGELFFAKFIFEYDVKGVALRRVLEWRIELDHDWSLKPGAYGRGLERLLPADIWAELATTYVGTEIGANWDALFRTTALFRRVASEVADALGHEYPEDVDDGVTAYLRGIRELARA